MPLSRIKLLPVDPAGFETAEPSWDWWDIDPGIKIVLAHLQAQGPSAAPSDVKRLKADAAGSLQVSLAGAAAVGLVGIQDATAAGQVRVFQQGGYGTGTYGLVTLAGGYAYDGAAMNLNRSASAVNLAAQSGQGVALVAPPGQWAVASAPAAGNQASASRAAGGAAVRHVCTGVVFSAAAAVAPAATQVSVQIRDGASGAGTQLFNFQVFFPAAIGVSLAPLVVVGLNLVGSLNTAMTAEFSAGVANVLEAASIFGYDAS